MTSRKILRSPNTKQAGFNAGLVATLPNQNPPILWIECSFLLKLAQPEKFNLQIYITCTKAGRMGPASHTLSLPR
jgi:hypothetical protein